MGSKANERNFRRNIPGYTKQTAIRRVAFTATRRIAECLLLITAVRSPAYASAASPDDRRPPRTAPTANTHAPQ